MKKTIIGLALSLLIGTASFANNEVTINQKAEQSFKKEFAQAKDVSWQKSGDMVLIFFKVYNASALATSSYPAGEVRMLARLFTY